MAEETVAQMLARAIQLVRERHKEEGRDLLLHLIRAEYPARYGTLPQGTYRGQYEQWYQCQALFWLGFVRMALGDMVGAENYFSQNVNEVESLEAKLNQEGQKIDNVCKIICEFRTKHLLEFIRTNYGKQPEVNLDSVLWVGPGRVSLKESTGKVVAMVFRRPGDQRAATFLREIDQLVKARGKDGLVGVTAGEDGIEAGRLHVLQRVEGDNQCCWTRLRRKLRNEGVVLLDRKRN